MYKTGLCALLVFVALAEGQNNFRPSQRFNNNNNNNFNNRNQFNNNNNNVNRFNNNNANRFNNNNVNGFNNNNVNRFNNNNNVVTTRVVNTNSNNNGNFRATPADRLDRSGTEIYPGCNGTVCLPQANLCAKRKTKVGHFNFGRKSYWVSWASDEQDLRNARWNWFTGRNYCRKMCMDMVSFETQAEQNFVEGLMKTTNVKAVHTAGRLCDKEVEGCDQPRFQPLVENGWFWASTLQMMHNTKQQSTANKFNNWATTGPKGRRQPDGNIKPDGFGEEACMALVDDARYGGLKWHDEPCSKRRHLLCEDLPTPNINFVRNQNPNINIP